jgi:hypothetical protein
VSCHTPHTVNQACRFQAAGQQPPHDLVCEKFHAAVRVVDHEPFACAQQFIRNHQRADRIIAGSSARIPDDMSIPFSQAGELCRIEPRVHAGKDRKAACGRHRQLALRAKIRSIAAVRLHYFFDDVRHFLLLD